MLHCRRSACLLNDGRLDDENDKKRALATATFENKREQLSFNLSNKLVLSHTHRRTNVFKLSPSLFVVVSLLLLLRFFVKASNNYNVTLVEPNGPNHSNNNSTTAETKIKRNESTKTNEQLLSQVAATATTTTTTITLTPQKLFIVKRDTKTHGSNPQFSTAHNYTTTTNAKNPKVRAKTKRYQSKQNSTLNQQRTKYSRLDSVIKSMNKIPFVGNYDDKTYLKPNQQSLQKRRQRHQRRRRRMLQELLSQKATVRTVLALHNGEEIINSMPKNFASANGLYLNEVSTNSSLVVGGGDDGGRDSTATATAALQQQLEPPAELALPLYLRASATLACLTILAVGVAGNLLVPIVVFKTKHLRNSTNLFLINLSVADLLVLLVCMPTMLTELHSKPETWQLGEAICKLSNFVEILAANGSILTILAISFERYYAICEPLKAGYKCTRLRALIIICIVWIVSCLLTLPVLSMATSSTIEHLDGSQVQNCILETSENWQRSYVFASLFLFFCLPLIVLTVVYWLIARCLVRENLALTATMTNCSTESRNTAKTFLSSNTSNDASVSCSPIPVSQKQTCTLQLGQKCRDSKQELVRETSTPNAVVERKPSNKSLSFEEATLLTLAVDDGTDIVDMNLVEGIGDDYYVSSAKESPVTDNANQRCNERAQFFRRALALRQWRSEGHSSVDRHMMEIQDNKSRNSQSLHYGNLRIMNVREAAIQKQRADSRRQVVIMLAFVVGAFFLLFAPYRMLTIWLLVSTGDQIHSLGMETYYNMTYFSRILIYLHSAINPIAYNMISTKFRSAFRDILRITTKN